MGRKERIIGVDTVYARRCNKTENGLLRWNIEWKISENCFLKFIFK